MPTKRILSIDEALESTYSIPATTPMRKKPRPAVVQTRYRHATHNEQPVTLTMYVVYAKEANIPVLPDLINATKYYHRTRASARYQRTLLQRARRCTSKCIGGRTWCVGKANISVRLVPG